jgi:hypothetical protein
MKEEMAVEVELQRLGMIRDAMEGTAKLAEPLLKQFLMDITKNPLFPKESRKLAEKAFEDTCDIETAKALVWADLRMWAKCRGYEIVLPADADMNSLSVSEVLVLKQVTTTDAKGIATTVHEPIEIPEWIVAEEEDDVRNLVRRRKMELAKISMVSGDKIWDEGVVRGQRFNVQLEIPPPPEEDDEDGSN